MFKNKDYRICLLTKRKKYKDDLINSKRKEILEDSPCMNCKFIKGEILNGIVYFICDVKREAFDISYVVPSECEYKEDK